jgi:hypothetical protein
MTQSKVSVCHLTTAHPANDVRISFRECKSLIQSGKFEVLLVAHGQVDIGLDLTTHDLGRIPKSRVIRIVKAQIVGLLLSLRLKATIWHIHDPELIFIGLWLRLLGKKVIWDAHEDYFLQFSPNVNYRKYIPRGAVGITNFIAILSLRMIDRYSTAIVCATNSISSKYKNSNKYIVGNQAVVKDFLGAQPKHASRQLLFTGTTDNSQCFKELVIAVKRFPEVTIALAGRNQHCQQILWAESVLGNQLILLGWLDRKELVKEISNSFLGVLTYEDVITNDHNSPNKLFEFSVAGLPCLSTPTKSNIEWNEKSDGAYMARGFGSNDLAEAISLAIDSEARWIQKSKSLRDWGIKNGDWEVSERELLSLYETLGI